MQGDVPSYSHLIAHLSLHLIGVFEWGLRNTKTSLRTAATGCGCVGHVGEILVAEVQCNL